MDPFFSKLSQKHGNLFFALGLKIGTRVKDAISGGRIVEADEAIASFLSSFLQKPKISPALFVVDGSQFLGCDEAALSSFGGQEGLYKCLKMIQSMWPHSGIVLDLNQWGHKISRTDLVPHVLFHDWGVDGIVLPSTLHEKEYGRYQDEGFVYLEASLHEVDNFLERGPKTNSIGIFSHYATHHDMLRLKRCPQNMPILLKMSDDMNEGEELFFHQFFSENKPYRMPVLMEQFDYIWHDEKDTVPGLSSPVTRKKSPVSVVNQWSICF